MCLAQSGPEEETPCLSQLLNEGGGFNSEIFQVGLFNYNFPSSRPKGVTKGEADFLAEALGVVPRKVPGPDKFSFFSS